MSEWWCPLPYRIFLVSWGPIHYLFVLVPLLTVFFLVFFSSASEFKNVLSAFKFSVSGFILTSSYQLELNFLQGNKYESVWVLLDAGGQADRNYLLQMLSYYQCVFLAYLIKTKSKNRCPIGVWICILVFILIPLIKVSVLDTDGFWDKIIHLLTISIILSLEKCKLVFKSFTWLHICLVT